MIREPALDLGSETGRRTYPALALVFHDPACDADDLARLCGHMTGPFKANGIHPMHVMSFGAGSVAAGIVAEHAALLGLVPPRTLAAVAPVTGFPARPAPRLLMRRLSPDLPPDAALTGADGDWPDLLSRLACPAQGPRSARGSGRTPAQAAAAATTLNALLRHILNRSPAPTRRFAQGKDDAKPGTAPCGLELFQIGASQGPVGGLA